VSLPLVVDIEPEGACGDLMEALEGAASHQPITNPATGGTTVYLQTSMAGYIMGVDTRQRLGPYPAPAPDR
jgi:hypothetical protein